MWYNTCVFLYNGEKKKKKKLYKKTLKSSASRRAIKSIQPINSIRFKILEQKQQQQLMAVKKKKCSYTCVRYIVLFAVRTEILEMWRTWYVLPPSVFVEFCDGDCRDIPWYHACLLDWLLGLICLADADVFTMFFFHVSYDIILVTRY